MTRSRYEGLPLLPPAAAAAVVCEVEKRNYLAHSIREIENALSKPPYFKHYRIITSVPPNKNSGAVILYRVNACEILLPSNCEKMDDKKIRLSLGHELGHLVRNMDKLRDSKILDHHVPSDEDELLAWEFAYHLIRLKGEQDKARGSRTFFFSEEDLKKTLRDLVMEKNPTIYNRLPESIRC
jgi:Zn-dependent peptidase ImmA (M78 family)